MFFKKKTSKSDFTSVPAHIAIIMDGNGRWAQKRGLSRSIGHAEGANTLRKIVQHCEDIGVKYLTVYAFSTENWKRQKEEVEQLMNLFERYIEELITDYKDKNSKIVFLGDRSALRKSLTDKMARAEKESEHRNGLQLNVALNYGGRQEITTAFQVLASKLQDGTINIQDIDENLISEHLYTKGIPDPDIIIRPSGEMRISNFLLWQAAYSEFWYNNILWPDFRTEHLDQAIYDFNQRNRRFGG